MTRQIHLFMAGLLLFAAMPLHSQEVIASSGDYFENSSGSLSFTLGEIATETLENDQMVLNQGFQQSGLTITKVSEAEKSPVQLDVYPNPASSYVILSLSEEPGKDWLFRVVASSGKIMIQKKIDDRKITVQLESCPPGIYLLQISDGNSMTHSYKIVKH